MARSDFVLAGTRVHRSTCPRVPGEPTPLDDAGLSLDLLASATVAGCCKPKAAKIYIEEAQRGTGITPSQDDPAVEGEDVPVPTPAEDVASPADVETEVAEYLADQDQYDPPVDPAEQHPVEEHEEGYSDLPAPEPVIHLNAVPQPLGDFDELTFPKQYRRALGRSAVLITQATGNASEADFKRQVVRVAPEDHDLVLSAWAAALADGRAFRATDAYRGRPKVTRDDHVAAYKSVEDRLEQFAAGVADVVSGATSGIAGEDTEGRVAGRAWAQAWGGPATEEDPTDLLK